jgi:hypothetical protein
MSDRTALAVLLLAILLGRFIAAPPLTVGATRVVSWRWFPVLLGAVTAVFMTWLWGGLDQVAVIHDEAAYLLQARLYASGHWTAPGLPLPEFFEQYHVLVSPVLTPKYFPGHALMLVPGIWLGLPGLMPVLLLGLCGALVFEVSRRLTNPWIGVVAWLLWMTSPGVMEFMPSYLSETTTAAAWMLGWLALLRWMEDDRARWLIVLAISIGIGFLTRPLTMLVFAIPVGVVVLVRVGRRKSWAELIRPFGVGFLCLGIWFLWCQRTTGSALHTPWELYRRLYIPDDTFGFGLTGQHPLRALNPDMTAFNEWVMSVHRDYTRASVPAQLRQRLIAIAANMWATRVLLLPLAALALFTTSLAFWLALGTAMLLVLAYLSYAHAPQWSVYYVEIQPLLAFATAVGWWRLASFVANRRLEWPLRSIPVVTPNGVFAMLASVVLLLPYTTRMVPYVAAHEPELHAYHRDFRDLVARAPGDHIMIFIHYAPHHSPHMSLVTNAPDLNAARAWTVYDRGAENMRLMKLDPHRTPYLFDDEHRVLIPIDSTGVLHFDHAIPEPGARDGAGR